VLLAGAADPSPTLTVRKTDASSGVPLQGATFRVHQGNLGGPVVGLPLVTGPTGTVTAELALGTYCVEETGVPPGYLRAPTFMPTSGCVDLTTAQPGGQVSVTDPRGGVLKVVKTDRSGATVTVPGARFGVHQDSVGGAVVATVTTDGSGSATAGLPAGPTYCLEETAAPPGYQLAPLYTPDDCVPVVQGETKVVSVSDPPVPATPAPTPTPSPSLPPTGELQISKVDSENRRMTTPGFTFNVRVGSVSGQVIATIDTDASGIAVAGALNPAVYCVEEISAPEGFQVAPSYSPSACVSVASDPTQGRNPTVVTVLDPPAPTPTPSAAGEAGAVGPSPSSSPRSGAGAPQPLAGVPARALATGMVGFGALLLVVGALMIVVAIRRRRRGPAPPPDMWYDSTIS